MKNAHNLIITYKKQGCDGANRNPLPSDMDFTFNNHMDPNVDYRAN